MNSKQRFTFMFVLVSLTMTMLFFQNCSQSGSLHGSSVTDPFIIDPPVIFAAKNSTCTLISTTFTTAETVYICIQNAGPAPIYGHALAGVNQYQPITISTAQGWTTTAPGSWSRGFVAPNGFGAGSFTAYVTHTDDSTAWSSTSFTVQ